MGYIYKVENMVTNGVYIGQTIKSIDSRWKQHINEAKRASEGARISFPAFHRAIIEYGPECFKVSMIEECEDKNLDLYEEYWIAKLGTYQDGYNSTKGGAHLFPEGIGQAVCQYSLDGKFIKEFASAHLAAAEVNVHPANIRKACNKQAKHSGGYQWEWKGEDVSNSLPPTTENRGRKGIPIQKYTKEGELVAEYKSAKEASSSTGITYQCIIDACSGKQKTAGGFIWKRVN